MSVRQFPGVNSQFNSNSDFSSEFSGLNVNGLIMGVNMDFVIEVKCLVICTVWKRERQPFEISIK